MKKEESTKDDLDVEKADDERCRIYASVSFAVLLLGIGIPLWWHTTAVPRVALPYSGIASLSHLDTRITTRIIVASASRNRAEGISQEIRRYFENAELHDLDVRHQVVSNNLLSFAYTPHELEKVAATFDLKPGDVLLLEARNLKDDVLVGSGRTLYFAAEVEEAKLAYVLSTWILRDRSIALTRNALTDPTSYSLDEENRRRFPANPIYDVLLTVVNPDPEKLNVVWDLPAVAEAYVQPFLNELSIVANFSVKSQWLYLVPLEVTPKQIPDSSVIGRHFALPEEVLPQLITPLEKKLASQVSLYPCINLVAYMVPCDEAPLHIYTRSGRRSKSASNVEAFLSPRWGGVVLSNPSTDVCLAANSSGPVTVHPEDTTIMGVFLAQLRLLLGIPDMTPIPNVAAVPLVGSKPREWELDSLLRIRTIEQLTSAKLTLQSLAQLLEEISNIVITETVGNRIKNALALVISSTDQLRLGNLREAFFLSKEASVTAEAAFTDPSLLALLYFPEDQKYAVYIPLFLPAMIPVLLSLKNIHRYYFRIKGTGEKGENETADANKLKSD